MFPTSPSLQVDSKQKQWGQHSLHLVQVVESKSGVVCNLGVFIARDRLVTYFTNGI